MGSLKLIDALEENSDKDIELSDERAIQERPLKKSEEETLLAIQQRKIQKLDEEIKDLQQDRAQRKYLSNWLFIFMCTYVLIVLAIVISCGLGLMYLTDTILGFLLTTTLADVVGIFSFVAKYLYHKKDS